MRFMENIINDIEGLRNNRAGEQHGYFCIDGKPSEDRLVIDTLDICRALADYEVDYDMADEDELVDGKDEYGWERLDYAERYVQYLIDMGYIEDWDSAKCDNSYNWSSPVSNDINFCLFKSLVGDGIYVLFRVHRWGDVRGNYTDNCLLHFDYEYEFYEAFDTEFRAVEVDGEEYSVMLNFFSEGLDIEDADYNCIGTIYSSDRDDAINDIRDLVAELKETA